MAAPDLEQVNGIALTAAVGAPEATVTQPHERMIYWAKSY